MTKPDSTGGQPASALIDQRIADLGGWRGDTLATMRKLIKEADPGVVEEWKWMGTPVWSHNGIADPAKLFNASLDGNARRAIDIHEVEAVEAGAFKALIRAAVALNGKKAPAKKASAKKAAAKK